MDIDIVREIFETGPTFRGDLGGEKEEAEGKGRGIDLGGEDRGAFMDKFENGGYSGIVVILFEEAKLHPGYDGVV